MNLNAAEEKSSLFHGDAVDAKVQSVQVKDYLFRFSEYLDERISDLNVPSSGFKSLDTIIGGFYKGKLYTVGARPAKGKTSFLTNVVFNNSVSRKVLLFSTEIDCNEFIERLISLYTSIPVFDFRTRIQELYDDLILNQIEKLEKYNIFINDDPRPNSFSIKKEVDLINPDLVVIDYLGQLFFGRNENEPSAIAEMMKELKECSRKNNVPILIASQLNRRIEERGGGEPVLSDLQGSGGIEQTSDVVLFIGEKDEKSEVDFIVKKNRYGPGNKSFKLKFIEDLLKFEELQEAW